MPLLEISVIPVGKDTASFSSDVTSAVRKIGEMGLKYQVTPTSTVVEGGIDQLWEIAKEIHHDAMSNGTKRVVTNMSIDHRTDKEMEMGHQVNAVHQSLNN